VWPDFVRSWPGVLEADEPMVVEALVPKLALKPSA